MFARGGGPVSLNAELFFSFMTYMTWDIYGSAGGQILLLTFDFRVMTCELRVIGMTCELRLATCDL